MLKRILPIITLIAVALPVAAASAKPPAEAHTSIVGGQNAAIADWPSIAFLLAVWDQDGDGQFESASGCTGTVIAPSWIVSAAHCAFRPDGQPVDAMVSLTGATDKTGAGGGEIIPADDLRIHPNWNPQTLHGDALLVHLRSRSSRPAMKLAVDGGPYVTVEDLPNAAGWGTIDEESTIGTDVLKEAYLELQSDQTCAAFAAGFDAATMTCAGTYEKAGACHGDSGGPLIVFDRSSGEPYLWGLTSFGPQLDLGMKPCELHAPAVFSWVPGFRSWITKTMAPPARPQTRPPVIQPARDTTAPVIRNARMSKKKLKRRRAAMLSFDVSEASAVTISVLRKTGRRYKTVATIPVPASAGRVKRRFTSKGLKRGSYKLGLVAVDAAGNLSTPVTVGFKVVR